MNSPGKQAERIANMTFAGVYPMYVTKVEKEIETPRTQQVRYLDKLVDELVKGRKMEKILRVA